MVKGTMLAAFSCGLGVLALFIYLLLLLPGSGPGVDGSNALSPLADRRKPVESPPRESSSPEGTGQVQAGEPPEVLRSEDSPKKEERQAILMVQAKEEMEREIENTVRRVFDPNQLLKAALAFGDLELDPIVTLDPDDDDGTLRFSLKGAPEGVRGEFWIKPFAHRDENDERWYSLRFEILPPFRPWILEGAARYSSDLEVTLGRDAEGKPTRILILPSLPVLGSESLKAGLDVYHGYVLRGAIYEWDLSDQGTVSCLGIGSLDYKNVRPADWPFPIQIAGNPRIEKELVDRLNHKISGFLKILEKKE